MLHGDIYDIQSRVKEEYPDHEIVYVGDGRYNVVEKRKFPKYEGDLDGFPLYSLQDVADIVFSFDHTPDMRVLYRLREADIYRHPGGPMAWYDEMMRKNEEIKERRHQQRMDEVDYIARDAHKHIFNELDGMSKTNFKAVNA